MKQKVAAGTRFPTGRVYKGFRATERGAATTTGEGQRGPPARGCPGPAPTPTPAPTQALISAPTLAPTPPAAVPAPIPAPTPPRTPPRSWPQPRPEPRPDPGPDPRPDPTRGSPGSRPRPRFPPHPRLPRPDPGPDPRPDPGPVEGAGPGRSISSGIVCTAWPRELLRLARLPPEPGRAGRPERRRGERPRGAPRRQCGPRLSGSARERLPRRSHGAPRPQSPRLRADAQGGRQGGRPAAAAGAGGGRGGRGGRPVPRPERGKVLERAVLGVRARPALATPSLRDPGFASRRAPGAGPRGVGGAPGHVVGPRC